MNGPDFLSDPVHQAMVAEEEAAKAAGMPWKDRSRLSFRRGRYRMQQNRAWRKAHPEAAREKREVADAGILSKALDSDGVERLVGDSVQWLRGRGLELLMKSAEGEPCRCCVKCKAQRPDLRAMALMVGVVEKWIALQLARIQSKRAAREKTDVELEWPAEGAKG